MNGYYKTLREQWLGLTNRGPSRPNLCHFMSNFGLLKRLHDREMARLDSNAVFRIEDR